MRKVRVRAIIEHDGKFLFVQHPNHDTGTYALPGGKLEEGEELIAGIEREVVEELGVKPVIGRLLYVQQLYMPDHESLEFFFEVQNGQDFTDVQLESTSHGQLELEEAVFIDPKHQPVLPEFLEHLAHDMAANDWPKVYVRSAKSI